LFSSQSIEQLSADSALIVTGTVTGEAAGIAGAIPGKDVKVLRIDRVMKGDPGDDRVPLAMPAQDGPISSSDITYPEGTSGLWFLRGEPTSAGTIYFADTPQRFVPEAEADGVLRALETSAAKD